MLKKPAHTALCALIGLLALGLQPAFAHGGAKAKRGGVVAMANDLGFELVATTNGAALYIEDHGKALAPTGMGGKLTVLQGGSKTEAPLQIAGDKLQASGLQLRPGAKVVASITTAAQKTFTVRFTVK